MPVVVQLDEGRFRMWSGRRRLGSWAADQVSAERVTPFRFTLIIEDTRFTFVPDDPTGFTAAAGAIVDLRSHTRFGLAARLRQNN